MTRVVFIGDVHLQHGHRRNPERLASLDQIIRECQALSDLRAWVFLGDVFHQRSSIDDRNAIAPRLQAMANVADVVILFGNHDAPGDLQILGRLKAAHPIHVLDRPQVLRLPGPIAIAAIPYAHKAEIVALGTDVHAVGHTAAPALDALALSLSTQLQEAAAGGAFPLFISHNTIVGARSSVGQPVGLERDIAIDAGQLARFGDVPKIFGHIHAPQALHGAIYAGSIARADFGEVEAKRYLVLSADHASQFALDSCPLDCPALWHVEGDLTRDGFTWRVRRGPDGEDLTPPAAWAGAEVRVRYRFQADEQAALDLSLVRAPFAGAARVELDPIALRSRAIRAEAVVRAASVPEKLAAYIQHTGGSWTPSLGAKLEHLQMADGTAFLTAVLARPALQEVA